MPRGKKLTEAERQRVVDLLQEHGGNRTKVARITKHSSATVQKIAEEEGITSNVQPPKNATEAHRDFTKAERLKLLNKAFERGEYLIGKAVDGKEFKETVIGIATLIDKRRVEDGEVSDRTEQRKGESLQDFFSEVEKKAQEGWEKRANRQSPTD